jgi:hypothetical protein
MSQATGYRAAAVIAGAVLLGGVCLAGCTGVTDGTLTHAVASGKATIGHPAGGQAVIDSFTAKLQPRAATSFEVKYTTAGRTPREIVYAVRLPGELMFQDTTVNGRGRRIVVNGSADYLCRSPGHARWSCQKLDKAGAAAQNKIFGVYTAAHWLAFLKSFTHTPGFAKYHVTTFTTMGEPAQTGRASAHPVGWKCLDFSPPGTHGIAVICAIAPGILGLVTYHTTTFMFESFDPSPPASLFRLPPGVTISKNRHG